MDNKVIVFGAGATGRAHVGLLAWQAGYSIVFVDKNPELVSRLQQAGSYRVRLYGGSGGPDSFQEVRVSGFRVYPHDQPHAIAEEFVDAALVLTAVFDQNLPDVAVAVAQGVEACRQAGRTEALNIIACENMMDSSSTLGRHVRKALRGRTLDYSEMAFGFPDCMISRVVPCPEPDPLEMITEDYNEWTVCAEAYKGPAPANLNALELVHNQTARLERKLFIHNGGHAVCGYVGFHRGCRYIHEAVADPIVGEHVAGALDELGEVVRRKHGFSAESIDQYKQDLGRRGAIPQMQDAVLRVVRDPIRKLSPRERLVAPALLAGEYSLRRAWIVRGIVAALKYSHPDDPQSMALAEKLERQGLAATVSEVCGLPQDSALVDEILRAWRNWKL